MPISRMRGRVGRALESSRIGSYGSCVPVHRIVQSTPILGGTCEGWGVVRTPVQLLSHPVRAIVSGHIMQCYDV